MKFGMKQTLALCASSVLFAAGVAHAAGVDEITPDVAKRLYSKDVLDPAQPVGASAYRDWKPKKGPPWTIGYASSYAGNTWRAAAMDRLHIVMANSDGHVALVVDDDGIGYATADPVGKMGFELMNAFATQLSGTLDVASDGTGTKVTLRYPLVQY